MVSTHPRIEFQGELNADYMRDALGRAGHAFNGTAVDLEKLNGGRTGAQVHKVTAGDMSYVVKHAPISSWQQENMGSQGEGPLWLSRLFENLPKSLECPIIDAAYHNVDEAWWLLMNDVSVGIRPRGEFGEEETLALWRAMAHLHAAYWDDAETLSRLPLVDVKATTNILAEPVYFAAGKEQREDWVARVVEEFMPLRYLLPIFLELIEPGDAEFYLEMSKKRDWHDELGNATPTLLHGDLRRANIAFLDNKVSLFDWEFAARGPAACDLQWSSFLTFWAYTPNDGKQPWERDHLRDAYLEELETQLGSVIDRSAFLRTWDLGWLRIISTLGYCLADTNLDNPDERADAVNRATVAMRMCREILGG